MHQTKINKKKRMKKSKYINNAKKRAGKKEIKIKDENYI